MPNPHQTSLHKFQYTHSAQCSRKKYLGFHEQNPQFSIITTDFRKKHLISSWSPSPCYNTDYNSDWYNTLIIEHLTIRVLSLKDLYYTLISWQITLIWATIQVSTATSGAWNLNFLRSSALVTQMNGNLKTLV